MKNKEKHTPGPWKADFETMIVRGNIGKEGFRGRGFDICSMRSPDEPEQRINIRLIAAAPDMLALLERFVEVARKLDNTDLHHVIMDEERDAVALLAKLA